MCFVFDGICGSREGGGGPNPFENHNNIGLFGNIGPDPLKNCSYQASIRCLAIIGTPAKRHLMAFRWRADNGPLIVVLGSSLPSSTNKTKKRKRWQNWTPSDKTFWIRAWMVMHYQLGCKQNDQRSHLIDIHSLICQV